MIETAAKRFVSAVALQGEHDTLLFGEDVAFATNAAAFMATALAHPEWAQAWIQALTTAGMPQCETDMLVAALPLSVVTEEPRLCRDVNINGCDGRLDADGNHVGGAA